jgi:hypothetical protein
VTPRQRLGDGVVVPEELVGLGEPLERRRPLAAKIAQRGGQVVQLVGGDDQRDGGVRLGEPGDVGLLALTPGRFTPSPRAT